MLMVTLCLGFGQNDLMLSMCQLSCHIQIIRFLELTDHSRSNCHTFGHILFLFIFTTSTFSVAYFHAYQRRYSISSGLFFSLSLFISILNILYSPYLNKLYEFYFMFANYLIKDTNALERSPHKRGRVIS